MIVIDIKRLVSRGLFAGELFIFAWVYLFGAHGLHRLVDMRTECEQTKVALQTKKNELQLMQEQIIAWNVHAFPKERMAREQLQMARKNEVVYYLN